MKSGAECVRPAFCACCTGRYSETSDLDLFVLMRNEDGYKACVTFILGGIGMDFYGVKWEWLEEEANYTTPYLAKLLNSKIVYCPENADRERFEALREKAKSILTAPYTEDDLHRAEAMFGEAERLFAKLMRERTFAQSRKYAAGLLNCLFGTICVLNKQVFKLSVRDRFTELEQMRAAGFQGRNGRSHPRGHGEIFAHGGGKADACCG